MKKPKVFPAIFLSVFLFLFVLVAPIFSQKNEAPIIRYKRYPFTLSWEALDYAGWYILEIENAKGKSLVNIRTTEPYFLFNAYPGNYKLKVSVYNKLGTLEAASKWRPFSVVLPPRKKEIVKEKKKEVKPRNNLILTQIEGMTSLGDLGLDQNYTWGFSALLTFAYTDFTIKDKLYKGWTVGNHIYFSGYVGKEDSFIDFVGSGAFTGFLGYRFIPGEHLSCLPFAEIGFAVPFLLENKDAGLTEDHISGALVVGVGSTFMLHFNKFFFSTTFAYSLNIFLDGEGEGSDFTITSATTENAFNFTIGCGLLF